MNLKFVALLFCAVVAFCCCNKRIKYNEHIYQRELLINSNLIKPPYFTLKVQANIDSLDNYFPQLVYFKPATLYFDDTIVSSNYVFYQFLKTDNGIKKIRHTIDFEDINSGYLCSHASFEKTSRFISLIILHECTNHEPKHSCKSAEMADYTRKYQCKFSRR